MALEVYTNDALGTVSSGGTTAPAPLTTETWTVVITQAFPSPTSGQQFHVCDTASGLTLEKMTVPAGNSGAVGTQTWTGVVRGAEGTTPVPHTAGFTIRQVVTSGDLGQFVDETSPQTVADKTFTDSAETVVTNSTASGTVTVDVSQGNVYALTMTGNISGFTITNVPAAGAVSLTLLLTQDATGGRTVTWTGPSITWLSGTTPSIDQGATHTTEVVLQTINGGTNWIGSAVSGAPSLPLAIQYGGTGSGTQNFTGLVTPTAVKNTSSSPYAAMPGDLVMVDLTGGSFTVNLIAAPANFTPIGVLVVKQSGANQCFVNTGGTGGTQDQFQADGTTQRVLAAANAGFIAQYEPGGSGPPGNWNIVTGDPLTAPYVGAQLVQRIFSV